MQQILKNITFIILLSSNFFAQDLSFSLDSDNLYILREFNYQPIEPVNINSLPDSSNWQPINIYEYGYPENEYFWLEAIVNLNGNTREADNLVIKIDGLSTRYKLFWDEFLTGQNGTFGEFNSPDIAFKTFYISPSQASAGKHKIRLLIHNNEPRKTWRDIAITFGYHTSILFGRDEYYAFQIGSAGVYLTAALICFALFWGGSRHRGYLIFAAISILSGIQFIKFPLIDYLDLSTTTYLNSIYYGNMLTIAFWILFALFILNVYKIPGRRLLLTFLILLSIIPLFFEPSYYLFTIRYYVLSLSLLGALFYAFIKNIKGSLAAFIGTLILLFPLGDILAGIQLPQYIESAPDILFVFFIILAMSQQVREDYRLHEEALRMAHNLEKELLRKNIQPHFLMNTLQSIKSYIREKPNEAIVFIQALAEEFRLINKIALDAMIPVSTEIELCRTHLQLMSFRKEVEYTLNTQISAPEENIPPMIFHTLIENGLTHAFENGESGSFTIEQSVNSDEIKYSISNNGTRLKTLANKTKDQIEEGLGLKFVRSRLEENLSGNYEFDYSFDKTKWRIIIKIKR